MKKFYILCFVLLSSIGAMCAGISVNPTVSPVLFRYNDQITVTYDVTGTALASLTTAYIWVWIPGANIDAKYNINPATAAAAPAKFVKSVVDGKTLFTITFIPSDFFTQNISAETQIGMLIKGTDWTTQSSDYVATFWDGSFQLALVSPTNDPAFIHPDGLAIEAATPVAADFKFYVDDVLTTQQDNVTSFSYTYTTNASSGKGVMKLTATSGANTEEVVFNYMISQESPQATRPQGLLRGINYSNDNTKVTLCLLMPDVTSVYVRGDFNDWTLDPDYLMNRDGEYFWIELTGLTPGVEYGFQYLLDESVYVVDPYADKVLDPKDAEIPASVYPNLKTFPAAALSDQWYFNRVAVFQTNQTPYTWQVSNFQKPDKESLVIYEVLIRDYFEDGHRSFESLADTLTYLKRLGINAIELMPIMDFNDNESWGYNPQFMFAPDKYYGTKNALKAFVDKCHQQGIAVILDIAMNHQNLANPYVMYDFDFGSLSVKPTNKFFNVTATHPYSVFYDMNHESTYTQSYLDTINYYWLHEYKVDGFRYDLSKGFTQTNNPDNVDAWGQYDASRIAILKRMADKLWEHSPNAYIILEHFAANTEEKELAEYRADEGKGMMLWGNLNYSFGQLTMGFSSGSDVSWLDYGQRGWSVPHAVGYMESHDEERIAYKNKQYAAESNGYSAKNFDTSLERIKAASTIFYSVPGPKMLWQWGELAFDYSINYCGDGTTSDNCRLNEKPVTWSYKNDSKRAGLFLHVADLIKLHTTYPVFANGDATVSGGTSLIQQVTVKSTPYVEAPASTDEMNVQTVANFDLTSKAVQVSFPHTGLWYDYYAKGAPVNVTSLPFQIQLPAGGYKLYTDVSIGASPITAVEEEAVTREILSVMPNPTTGQFRISEVRRNVDYSLLDSRGIRQRLVKQDDGYDISHLPGGMYILVGSDSNGKKSVVKIIKQ